MSYQLSLESSFMEVSTDNSSHVASSSSTPPTTLDDDDSMHSVESKHDMITVADAIVIKTQVPEITSELLHIATGNDAQVVPGTPVEPTNTHTLETPVDTPSSNRSRRSRGSAPNYNLARLSGTAGHGKRRTKGDSVSARHLRRALVGQTPLDGQRPARADEYKLAKEVEDQDEASALDASANPTPTASPSVAVSKSTQVAIAPIEALDLTSAPEPPKRISSLRKRKSTESITKVEVVKKSQALRSPRRISTRAAPSIPSPDTRSIKSNKRSRKSDLLLRAAVPRELRHLQDTPEFAHVDDRPVIHTVWSNGKYVDPNAPKEPARKKAKIIEQKEKEDETVAGEEEPQTPGLGKRRPKKWLDKGLYAGQDFPSDVTKGLTPGEKKKYQSTPEMKIDPKSYNSALSPPLFNGLRTLLNGRDFKLPYQVCNPLPPGQPKPDEWKKMTKNRFIGDSKEYWRKSPHFHDCSSKCVCKPEDGCGESCQNRIMLYECDSMNCNVGKDLCKNRAFADLTTRRTKGGKYRVGVEVIKTSDRGHGVRSNRCFRPGQIIMEYAGEIITEEECERRMNEVYKDNECYYLMSFDQNMIIDATTGSIARFVNHSCNPNCRMIKWIVSGQPRMALFAGDKPIMTGDELTYDYNFDPFSAKNVQKCLCGEDNCRGVLGPKPREIKAPKIIKAAVKAGKRKLDQLLGKGKDGTGSNAKKRKIQPIKSVKQALSAVSLNATKKAAAALKKGMTNLAVNATKKALTSKPGKGRKATVTLKKTVKTVKKVAAARGGKGVTKAYKKTVVTTPKRMKSVKSAIVAKGERKSPPRKRTPTKKAAAAAIDSVAAKKTKKNVPNQPANVAGTVMAAGASEIKVAAV